MQAANPQVMKYTFSGHDSFQCRQLWLKKGYDYLREGRSFNDGDAVVKLGVGKNMISAIRYWMKAFNILNSEETITEFGTRLLDEEHGYDPYLEDEASLWLLHYQLVKTAHASIYSIIFNKFRKERLFFSKDIFLNYLKRLREVTPELVINENTVVKDFNVFVNMYKEDREENSIEDSFSGVLSEIGLLKRVYIESVDEKKREEQFQIENNERDDLPSAVVFYSILDNPIYSGSINVSSLQVDEDSPSSIFALSPSGLLNKITEIALENRSVIFTDHAGIKELQFKKRINPYSILDKYYGK